MSYMTIFAWKIEENFFLVSLTELILGGNNIVAIGKNSFSSLKHLQKLFLRSCKLFRFVKQIFLLRLFTWTCLEAAIGYMQTQRSFLNLVLL